MRKLSNRSSRSLSDWICHPYQVFRTVSYCGIKSLLIPLMFLSVYHSPSQEGEKLLANGKHSKAKKRPKGAPMRSSGFSCAGRMYTRDQKPSFVIEVDWERQTVTIPSPQKDAEVKCAPRMFIDNDGMFSIRQNITNHRTMWVAISIAVPGRGNV